MTIRALHKTVRNLSRDDYDAVRLIDAIASALAWPTCFPEEVVRDVAAYIETPEFNTETESREIIKALAAYLRQCAAE